ncbi:asparagine synthase (glutamine-hydrolyzing) [Massilia sp. Root335]|uniref:asparagine synthase (glutamine-hydrolyzing) n=1 Tax=Massilia sp. Root335 TaxID=1736517 RepID=UPI0006FFA4B5|nr:asparagine synthase (glutamine-hydrolyzing) [Massilia sp. Root335]KQV52512.1 asparagine synthase [Massilia sp. Root335]
MCGITGWVDFELNMSTKVDVLKQMTESLANRGPDADGIWHDAHAAIGHRRLSIIDLSGGRQPMEAGTMGMAQAVLTFCGEIYNYRELRKELQSAGHAFETESDTEVLLKAYLQWGEDMTSRLNGMYALGIWNRRTEELVLIRDRIGVKPLYYYPTPTGILFGSEPKAILANPAARRRLSMNGLREIFDMIKTPEQTVYDGMFEVRPGHIVRFSRKGLSKRAYWSLQAAPHTDDYGTTVRTVRDILSDAVTRQMVADVPICTLLSGGLDSSAITGFAAQSQGSRKVRSFSVDFKNNMKNFEVDAVRGAPDAPFARALAEHVGAEHTEVLLDSSELLDKTVRSNVLRALDMPSVYWGDMWPSLYLLFRSIKNHSTVALSGEAADEIFGGYKWFHNPAAIQADTFPWLTPGSSRYFGGLGLLDPDLRGQLDIEAYRKERYLEALKEVPVLPGESAVDRRMREITYLNLTRFLQTLLDRNDRMSMAVGLEVRVPFCDHRLVDYVFNVPWHMKNADGREKSLLRAAAKEVLPEVIYNRVKTPYPATQDPRYENGLRDELAELLADSNAPARPLLDLKKAGTWTKRTDAAVSHPYNRGSLEATLSLNRWMKEYDLELAV